MVLPLLQHAFGLGLTWIVEGSIFKRYLAGKREVAQQDRRLGGNLFRLTALLTAQSGLYLATATN